MELDHDVHLVADGRASQRVGIRFSEVRTESKEAERQARRIRALAGVIVGGNGCRAAHCQRAVVADLLEAANETSPWRLALLVGCGGGAMTHALEHGLSWRQADNWAIKIGKHPCEVWGVRWWTAIEPWDEEDET